MKFLLLLLCLILTSVSSWATVFSSPIYSTSSKKFISFSELEEQLSTKEMIIIGELHNRETHHQNQKLILEGLESKVAFNVGLEFVTWDKQMQFDQYQDGRMPQIDFISQIWGENNFNFAWYRPLIEAAGRSGGHAYGINAPRKLTSKIAKVGLDGLTDLEKETLMPPEFTLGSDLYKEHFAEVMGGHQIPEPMFTQYFQAQSTWDESMAYQALGHMNQDLFVIIVGQFHIEYKLGLPARLRARDPDLDLATIVQVEAQGRSLTEVVAELEENDKYGVMGDYILITQ